VTPLFIEMHALFSTTALDAAAQACPPELRARVDRVCERAMHEMLPVSMLLGALTALGCVLVLWELVPHHLMLAWLGLRLLVNGSRLRHSHRALKTPTPSLSASMQQYRALALVDGVAWGALGWGLTPVMQLDVAIVTIGVLIGVAALGTFMLQVDLPSARLFVVSIMLPNALYALHRGDKLGVFCCTTIIGLMLALMMEALRSNRRILELLQLRFQSEAVTLAQAEALKQAALLAETKSRFVATMSHEMRTPLHGILGLVRLLRQHEKQPQAIRQLDLIRGTGDHLVHVINDILDYSRMEAGGLPLHQQPFDLPALIKDVAETSRVGATDKGLSLLTRLDIPSTHRVLGDPVRLRQVLHNLLGNAIKFTPSGHVSLHAWHNPANELVTIEVSDSGIGIPAEEQSRVFDAFHQAEGTYQQRLGGTGLGLTISRDLCLAMGGELRCRSQVGEGSVFTFSLPLPAAPLPAEAPARVHGTPAEATALTHDALRVLLVEDNPVNAIVAEAELQNMGLQVVVMRNGRQAVDWLVHHRPDLVLMDCDMPEMDGFEATRLIRQHERESGQSPVGIVALTANDVQTHAERCREAGMNGHLGKPFRPDDLARVVNRHLPREHCAH
jgi:signal transduction histidine kinase/CheY-like chemotaxis protein